MCQSSNLTTRSIKNNNTESKYGAVNPAILVPVACACMLFGQYANAAGGCGSVCLPLDALYLDKTQVPDNSYRLALTSEYANFDNFREGSSSIKNPGGNKAIITQTTLQGDYGLSSRWTVSMLVPYIKKKQYTKKFGTRIAEGIGDISIFSGYELLSKIKRMGGRSASLGLGIKLPTGSIDEPENTVRLPPAFQVGSGAFDLIPTASFHQFLGKGAVFGGAFWKIPLEENKRGYKFGQEIEVNVGADYPSPFLSKNLSFQISATYLAAERDNDSEKTLPARLRNGTEVLNTGGSFLDIAPGFRWKFSNSLTLQTRFSIPVYENWNGKRSTNVGQVAQDLTSLVSIIYTGS